LFNHQQIIGLVKNAFLWSCDLGFQGSSEPLGVIPSIRAIVNQVIWSVDLAGIEVKIQSHLNEALVRILIFTIQLHSPGIIYYIWTTSVINPHGNQAQVWCCTTSSTSFELVVRGPFRQGLRIQPFKTCCMHEYDIYKIYI
jgi:hypothetical protein